MKSKPLYDYDVFLSFAGKDEELVKPIWYELSVNGLRVFWSNQTLKENVGQSFFSVIQDALEKSEHFLLFCSKHSIESRWVQEESAAFYSQCYIPSDKTRRLILYHDDSFDRESLPTLFRTIQTSNSLKEIIHELGGTDIRELRQENKKLKTELSKLKNDYQELRDKYDKLLKNNPKTILIVDDEESLQLFYSEELEERGYNTHSAYNGKEALEMFDEISPDAVILDICLPGGMDGIEVLRQLRKINKEVPIILNSAYQEYRTEIASWAAHDYIVKSADPNPLFKKLEEHLYS